MLVAGGKVFVGDSFVDDAVVQIEGDRITGIVQGEEAARLVAAASANEVVDAQGCFVVPGFIDLHFHGCMGHDLCEGTPEALDALASWEASNGVTAICPATMTFPESVLGPVMDTARAFEPTATQAALVGINMEGPFISPNKVGVQNPAYVIPCDAQFFGRLQERSGGLVKLVDVAPEEPGALDFIREVAGEVRVSIAHTCADFETATLAYEAGARQATHLCNAMPALLHREPGVIAAAYDCKEATVELICDGVHIHPAMVRVVFGLFGDDRVILISDTMEAAGLADGEYELGGQAVTVRGNRATLHDGTIAGGVTNVASCLRIAVLEMGIPLESAVKAASANPARALGIQDERGSIAAGKIADVVVLDDSLNVRDVILRGNLL